MLDALFARWLKSGTPPSAPARPARLRLEPLEPREVPAADVWVGHTTDFTDPANWSDGLPTAEDELYFTGQVSGTSTTFHVGPKTYPGSGGEGGGVGVGMGGEGDPPGDGPPGGDGSWTYTFPDHYVGIYLEGGYAGVVSFPSDLTFNHYWQDTGATSNTAAGLTTTVTSNFFWAGGTLNDTANAGTLDLKGVISGVIGTDTSVLSSGSKIVLEEDGIATDVTLSGILNVLNGVGVDVLEDCTLKLQQVNAQLPQGGNKPAINADDKVLAKGKVYSEGGKVPSVKVDGGSLEVGKGGLEVTNKVPGTDWSVQMVTGKISINNGETLKVANGVYVQAGELLTNSGTVGVTQIATIDGEFRIDGGEIKLGRGDGNDIPNTYSTLKVTKEVKLWGGTFVTKMSPASGWDRDAIDTDKTLDCKAAFIIDPRLQGGARTAVNAWAVLVSKFGFVDNTDPTVLGTSAFAGTRTDSSGTGVGDVNYTVYDK